MYTDVCRCLHVHMSKTIYTYIHTYIRAPSCSDAKGFRIHWENRTYIFTIGSVTTTPTGP